MSVVEIGVVTFDCYGTLIDWEGGAGSFLYALALQKGASRLAPGRVLRDHWERIQFEIIQGEYRSYKAVLRQSLERWCREQGYTFDEADGDALVGAMRSWQPFPDTRPSLQRAHATGLKLVIVSNTDRDILEHSIRHLDVPFDLLVTAEDAGAYKPSETIFRHALHQIGEPPERVLHVAFGFEYDIRTARRLGMRTAWINRHAEPAPGPERPDYEWRDLWGLSN
jgi:2-haloalkanoic acid dehalogenase type II